MNAHAQLVALKLSYVAARTIERETRSSMLDGMETGGILLGDHSGDDIVNVRFAGTPGPNAVRRPDFFLRDLGHSAAFAEHCYRRYGVAWIGEWHTHPTHAPFPSSTDLTTYDALLHDPELNFGTEFIAMIAGPCRPASDRWVLKAWACRSARYRPLVIELPAATTYVQPTQKAPGT